MRGTGYLGSLIAALAALAVSVVPVASAAGIPRDQFCVSQVLVDYNAPLQGLPEVREPPASARLPFGPKRLAFHAVPAPGPASLADSGSLVVEGDPIRFQLSLSGAAGGPMALGWEVESRLVRVSQSGRSLKLVKRKRERIGELQVPSGGVAAAPRVVGFGRSPEVGTYRYDIVFRDGDGGLLGHYHRYYVVVARSSQVTLALNGTNFRPGDVLAAQVQNFGTEYLSYGVAFSLERSVDGVWAPVNLKEFFGENVGFILIGLGLPPGSSDDCSAGFTVPANALPGLYRIAKSLTDVTVTVSAPFTIEPAL